MDHYEYTELLKTLSLKMDNIKGIVKPEMIHSRLEEIEALENDQDFWNDAKNAAVIQKEKTQLERKLERFNDASAALTDALELYEMAVDEKDDETISSLYNDAAL